MRAGGGVPLGEGVSWEEHVLRGLGPGPLRGSVPEGNQQTGDESRSGEDSQPNGE